MPTEGCLECDQLISGSLHVQILRRGFWAQLLGRKQQLGGQAKQAGCVIVFSLSLPVSRTKSGGYTIPCLQELSTSITSLFVVVNGDSHRK